MPSGTSPTAARRATTSQGNGLLAQLFGFAQFEFPGTLNVPDGRYLARDAGSGAESVLVIETLAAPGSPPPRRRRSRRVEPDPEPPTVPVAKVTAVRAFDPFDSEDKAAGWLEEAGESEEAQDELLAAGMALLNRALHAHGASSGDPTPQELALERAATARLGYGSGEEVAAGRFSAAREIGTQPRRSSRRRRADELHPQERVAAVLRGRERLDACETLLPRARADLESGRTREAALQLRIGLESLLSELENAVDDPGHERDMATLHEQRRQVGEIANAALKDEIDSEASRNVEELLDVCERVLRRRRILG